jgi:hypothetical protein
MQTLFIRKNKTITNLETNAVVSYKSINAAKKESRKLQNLNGGLGRGSLVVL